MLKTIDNLKNKSGGIDKLHAKVIKNIRMFLATPLTVIFNTILTSGIFSSAFKMAEIVPVHKSGSKSSLENYRPISLISNFAKIVEVLLFNRLYKFFDDCNIFSCNQYGFRKGKSTNQAIAKVTEFIYSQLDSSKPVIAVFLDLAKAFDTVDHNILLSKLERHGVRGLPFQLIKSYLSDRYQFVNIEGHYSSRSLVRVGVPQGTVLGPLFFIIFVNDLLDLLNNNNIIAYADDTVILNFESNWAETEKCTNEHLEKVFSWLCLL